MSSGLAPYEIIHLLSFPIHVTFQMLVKNFIDWSANGYVNMFD